ncbi:peptide chain release factor N(5)-glutamine methyltransferase [Roseimicrobium sp. ORNL1]|uniref:peptide chain release factor N(5)-glutamine methyltransferase n=1 Tax=Roseimicrobium sp. ORNL1 TaxID=2711231 RepID=UPI0013E16AE1|nr:peptide chain release factor N(5)-glutamine methyltransferase [Roseimicrobium sp. ORNL1]QIF03003.1 peptide chain release factor N(5)-glutamine methyltransferase [Roseimicrobium sp. ORNL1]
MKPLLETLQSGTEYLAKRGVEEARLNMEHLLAHVLGCRRLDLYLRFDQQLNESELQPLRELTKRRGEGEPLQHLLGTVEFHGSEFVCDHRALIPRPETEHFVHLLTEHHHSKDHPASVLDVGTGSGCIGLSLAKAWPGAAVTLVDLSEDALELARLNVERAGLSAHAVKLVRSDLFEKLSGATFDLIVANLPYIPAGELAELSREVRRDPTLALDGGPSGLDIIFRLLAEAPQHLSPGGLIALELHHDQALRVSERLQSLGFTDIQTHRDLPGIDRFVFARHPGTPPAAIEES